MKPTIWGSNGDNYVDTVFRDVTLCCLKTETVFSPETSVNSYHTTRLHPVRQYGILYKKLPRGIPWNLCGTQSFGSPAESEHPTSHAALSSCVPDYTRHLNRAVTQVLAMKATTAIHPFKPTTSRLRFCVTRLRVITSSQQCYFNTGPHSKMHIHSVVCLTTGP